VSLARLALLVAALLLVGCSSETVVPLRNWTLEVEGRPSAVALPAHLEVPDRPTHYTLRSKVKLAPELRDRPLTLAIPYLPARASLRVNGAAVTPLDRIPASDYRSTGAHRWRVEPAAAEELSLELIVDHRWTQSAWFDSVPRLSPTEDGDPGFLAVRGFNLGTLQFGLWAILLAGFTYALVFVWGAGKRAAAGWFALEAFSGSLYPAFGLGITQAIFGVYDAAALGVGLSVAAYANVRFVHSHCRLGKVHRAWGIALAASVASYLVAHGPFQMSRYAAPTTIALMLAAAIYQVPIVYRHLRAKAPSHIWLVPFAWPFAHVFACADFAAWAGLGELFGGVRAGPLGIGIISVVQSIALIREYLLSLDLTAA
jgi:hypothetical protein